MRSDVDCSHSPPLKPEAGPCYTDLSLVTSASTLGAVFFLNLPSNLTRFSLYGCAAPSKTKLAYQLVQTSYKIRIRPRPWKTSGPPPPLFKTASFLAQLRQRKHPYPPLSQKKREKTNPSISPTSVPSTYSSATSL